jgi:hypothetical protein
MDKYEPGSVPEVIAQDIADVCRAALGFRGVARIEEQISGGASRRSNVIRVRLDDAPSAIPLSVVAKAPVASTGERYSERSGLEFLGSIPALHSLIPAVYGIGPRTGVLVMEDLRLSGCRTMSDLLGGNDPEAADRACVDLARALGRLHAETIEHQASYDVLRSKSPTCSTEFQVDTLGDAMDRLPGICRGLRLTVRESFLKEVRELSLGLRSPGDWRCYTWGDVCPSNVVVANGAIKIVDFEMGGCRHALVDGAYPQMRHLASAYGNRLPSDLRVRMQTAYRAVLIPACMPARDDAMFARAMAAACTGWMAVILLNLRTVVKADQRWGTSTVRQRILAAVAQLNAFLAETGSHPALRQVTAEMSSRLGDNWKAAVDALPLFPAFSPQSPVAKASGEA